MYRVAQVLTLAVLLAFGAAMGAMAQAVVSVPNDDPEMAQAQAAMARATLPDFWKAVEKPGAGEEGFALKVALSYGPGNSEHIWVNNLERKGGKIYGTINNEPRYVKGVRQGQRIELSEAGISDWMYMRAGKIVGNHTMRPLLKRLPPQEAARYRAMLAEP